MNGNPELDRRVLPLTILAVLILALTAWGWLSRGPHIDCPAPDHPVYAASIHQWICGESATFGVKAK